MNLALAVLCAVGLFVIVTVTSPWMNQRTRRQPIPASADTEADVVAAVKARPSRYPYLRELQPPDFVYPEHTDSWAAFETAFTAQYRTPVDTTSEATARVAAGLDTDRFLADVHSALADNRSTAAYFSQVPTVGWEDAAADDTVMHAAGEVLATGTERRWFPGAAPVVPAAEASVHNPAKPALTRQPYPRWRTRRWIAAAGAAVAAFAAALTVHACGYTGLAGLAATVSLLVLLFTSVVIACVDLDTLLVDIPVWACGTAAAWLAAATAAALIGEPFNIALGVVSFVVVGGLFEGVNWVYTRVRGRHGQGFGDTLIIIGTVGVPVTLTGDPVLAYYTVMASLLSAVLAWVIKRVAGKVTARDPFAFGPWLAIGWIAGLIVWAVT